MQNQNSAEEAPRSKWPRSTYKIALLTLGLALLAAVAWLIYREMQTSELQARYLTDLAAELRFALEPGPSSEIRFPKYGPADERLGYTQLPEFLQKLAAKDHDIEQQTRVSSRFARLTDLGLFPVYREKSQAGLRLLDCHDQPIFSASYPERIYPDFDSIPRVIVDTLLFIENRELLDTENPKRNPAIEWDRLAKAVVDRAAHALDSERDSPGGSTLATQIEKFRHSPEGRTSSVREKFRQMGSASIRSYLDGEQTMATRQRIVRDYLNSVPLAAAPGYGEINGLGDGLWAWYGVDFAHVNRVLQGSAGGDDLQERALAYKQVLSLMIAQRRPSSYLGTNAEPLEKLTDSYLRLLANAGVIGPTLRDAALETKLEARASATAPPPISFVKRKAANTIRANLAGLLDIPSFYKLDRLDLTAHSTLDRETQEAVTRVLVKLKDPAFLQASGMRAARMMDKGDPAGVIYSFTLLERGEGANLVRIQADSYDQPFDINEGAKLDLGSTAKLRTLVTYLEIIAGLHERYSTYPAEKLRKVEVGSKDRLTRWAIDYLAAAKNRDLKTMLEAAMDRRYSANPGEKFFTGGGLHTFVNFKHEDDSKVPSVWEALQESINLAFIRLMRDIVHHYMFQIPGSTAKIMEDISDPKRREYLGRFADREGQQFIYRFYRKYQGKTPQQALELLLQGIRPTPQRVAAIYRFVDPDSGVDKFGEFMRTILPSWQPSANALEAIYDKYSPDSFSLADRGFVARVHPLELWLVRFLRAHPGSTQSQAVAASVDERQQVYGWLFKTRQKNAQDKRILGIVEVEGFLEIHRAWQRLGYPFDSLVPSYATAIGSSADRPAALAELVGILLNDGMRLPTVRVERLHFAEATPYETTTVRKKHEGKQVLNAEVAAITRRAMLRVVEQGTARRIHKAFVGADGAPIEVGGKTGTGDHRFDTYGSHGQLISSRVVSREATFVFFIGDRFFGTVTAYVPGPKAAGYSFTSSLPVQILKIISPSLMPLVEQSESNPACEQR